MAHRHPLQNVLGPLLRPFSLLYGGAALARRRLAEQGFPPSALPPRPCVSVGNISWGGTGKTPVIDWLLSWSGHQGLRAAVLTRGYGAHPPFLPFPVTPDARPADAGDEPLMLARRHPQAMILADPDRNRAVRAAMSPAGPFREGGIPDLFLLDDGFQHISTGRHLDLVLLDADDLPVQTPVNRPPSNWNRVLPAGTWREPARSLNAAGAFLIKSSPQDWPALLPALRVRLEPFPRPVFAFCLRPQGLRLCSPARGEHALPATAVDGPYLLTSGVGNPAQVRRTAEDFLGRPPERHVEFPDHHNFAAYPEDVAALAASGLPVVCTAKDAVKLETLGLPRLYALDVEAAFFAAVYPSGQPGPGFPAWWQAWWHATARRPHAAEAPSHPSHS